MKKLMIVPGNEAVIPVIKAAHNMGIYVITADNRPENPGHMLSDEYVNVSILDSEGLLKEARRLHIDGILTYKCDMAAVPVAYVTEKMNLPGVGPYESVCILQNKGLFRNFLKTTVSMFRGRKCIQTKKHLLRKQINMNIRLL